MNGSCERIDQQIIIRIVGRYIVLSSKPNPLKAFLVVGNRRWQKISDMRCLPYPYKHHTFLAYKLPVMNGYISEKVGVDDCSMDIGFKTDHPFMLFLPVPFVSCYHQEHSNVRPKSNIYNDSKILLQTDWLYGKIFI